MNGVNDPSTPTYQNERSALIEKLEQENTLLKAENARLSNYRPYELTERENVEKEFLEWWNSKSFQGAAFTRRDTQTLVLMAWRNQQYEIEKLRLELDDVKGQVYKLSNDPYQQKLLQSELQNVCKREALDKILDAFESVKSVIHDYGLDQK